MDLTTILGFVCAFAGMGLSVALEGGNAGAFINVPAALIVFGGTLGAVVIATPLPDLLRVPIVLKQAFFPAKQPAPQSVIQMLVDLSRRARREGLLGLEPEIAKIENAFLRNGLQLVVDGSDGEVLESVLHTEMRNRSQRHRKGIGFFEALGGLAPTLGVTGTVMGLVHMMGNLNDPSSMGPAIAGAFIATLYGVASANIIFLPIGGKLKARSEEEKLLSTIITEGLLSLQAGENAMTIEEKLKAYLPLSQRAKMSAGGGGDSGQGAEGQRNAA